eukprot:190057-Chlamydomonas_euryale.AAC.3
MRTSPCMRGGPCTRPGSCASRSTSTRLVAFSSTTVPGRPDASAAWRGAASASNTRSARSPRASLSAYGRSPIASSASDSSSADTLVPAREQVCCAPLSIVPPVARSAVDPHLGLVHHALSND